MPSFPISEQAEYENHNLRVIEFINPNREMHRRVWAPIVIRIGLAQEIHVMKNMTIIIIILERLFETNVINSTFIEFVLSGLQNRDWVTKIKSINAKGSSFKIFWH